jgi:uncharacterized protein
MRDATIVYLHGFNSSPGGVKSTILAAALERAPDPPRLWRPQLPHRPLEAMRSVTEWIDGNVAAIDQLTLVGSSLGGFYATWLAQRYGARAVLINPAIHPDHSLAAFAGPQFNPHTGEHYELTPEHFAELRALAIPRITGPDRYLLLVRSGDELLDWREAVTYYAGAWQHVLGGGNHGWEDFVPEVPTLLQFARIASS